MTSQMGPRGGKEPLSLLHQSRPVSARPSRDIVSPTSLQVPVGSIELGAVFSPHKCCLIFISGRKKAGGSHPVENRSRTSYNFIIVLLRLSPSGGDPQPAASCS
jgi:hypothetical protein